MDKNIKKIVNFIELPPEGIDIRELEKQISIKLLGQAKAKENNVNAHAARLLNMGRTTFVERCRRHGI